MSMKPQNIPPVPDFTAAVARAAFPKGNIYLQIRDTLGSIYIEEDFTDLFSVWLGLCPASCITGGKVKNSRTRRVINRAANAFRLATVAAGKTRSALGAFYRRLRTRLGTPKAITATAHKLARLFYRLWRNGGTYDDPGINYYEQRYQEQILKRLQEKAQTLGFELVATSSTQIFS